MVSPFNVEWGCYMWAGGMEGSEFCLFWVVFPVRCISSICPRFYFRKHAFCFLPLVAVLESPQCLFKKPEGPEISLMPIILTTWEAEIGRITVPDHPGHLRPPSSKKHCKMH
jgi:hypothetical protein